MNVVIVSKPTLWFDKLKKLIPLDNVTYITKENSLESHLQKYNPKWVFFFHWSNIIPKKIYNKYRCVILHTSNLPNYRGGSPIQHQILDGIVKTDVNALIAQHPIDSGNVYCKETITLQGNLNDIWSTLTYAASKVITKCVLENPTPTPQLTTDKVYKRKLNNFLKMDTLESIYDQIRMLDGNGYPPTHLIIDGFKLEFTRAKYNGDEIITDVKISKIVGND